MRAAAPAGLRSGKGRFRGGAGRYVEIRIDQPARDYIFTKGERAISLAVKEWAGGV